MNKKQWYRPFFSHSGFFMYEMDFEVFYLCREVMPFRYLLLRVWPREVIQPVVVQLVGPFQRGSLAVSVTAD
jgi:hypothetical protein